MLSLALARRSVVWADPPHPTPPPPSAPSSPRGSQVAQSSWNVSATPGLEKLQSCDKILSLTSAAYIHPAGTPLQSWSIDDVGDFLTSLGYEAYLDRFVEHEIDGKALSLVKDHHLLMTLKLRLGPTLKICEHVNAIKASEESAEEG